ncbi:MAG: VWA domain-containing protein [Polyangia bacterium]
MTAGCNRGELSKGPAGGDFGATTTDGGQNCFEQGSLCGQDMSGPSTTDAAWAPPPTVPGCGEQTYALSITQNPPNIHLVIDRSGSMSLSATTGAPPKNGDTAKWDDLSSTLTNLLGTYGGQANQWGMSIFPTTQTYESCVAGNIAVPMADPASSVPAIENVIGQYNSTNLLQYNGKTPTSAAIQGVLSNVSLSATDRNNYVVLMTDGIPTCGTNPGSDVAPLIAQLAAQTPSVRTFVIGFGSDTQSNPTFLNQWAVSGHTDLPGATKYYQASNAAALQQAFSDIVSGVAACTFTLTAPPADPTLVVGQLNGAAIATDASNGFTYDVATQSVTFHGSSCQLIQGDPSTQVSVVYGCPATDAPEIY